MNYFSKFVYVLFKTNKKYLDIVQYQTVNSYPYSLHISQFVLDHSFFFNV